MIASMTALVIEQFLEIWQLYVWCRLHAKEMGDSGKAQIDCIHLRIAICYVTNLLWHLRSLKLCGLLFADLLMLFNWN